MMSTFGYTALAVRETRRRGIRGRAFAPEASAFLTSLAVDDKVASSTQNQALSALLFLYRDVLGTELPWLGSSRPPGSTSTARLASDGVIICTNPSSSELSRRRCEPPASPSRPRVTHVLNRGSNAVRSPADRMFLS